MLALAAYDFSTAGSDPRWRIASGTLQSGRFDQQLLQFTDGVCFGCPSPQHAAVPSERLQLEFETLRTATMTIGELPPRRIVAMPWGVDYAGDFDADGDLPLPDLRGSWVVAFLDTASEALLLELEQAEQHPDALLYRDALPGSDHAVRCEEANGAVAGRCTLLAVARGVEQALADFALGDIGEDTLRGTRNDGQGAVFARRIPAHLLQQPD